MSLPNLPFNINAEQSVLGAMLIDREAFTRVREILSDSDLFADAHRRIFRAIARLARSGIAIDITTVDDALIAANEADLVGGLAYLAEIANATPSSANVESYAVIVKQRSQARDVIAHATAIVEAAQSPHGDVREALHRLNNPGRIPHPRHTVVKRHQREARRQGAGQGPSLSAGSMPAGSEFSLVFLSSFQQAFR
jgi:replicative DNA helicase